MKLLLAFLLITNINAFAQKKILLPLWPGGAAHSNGLSGPETGANKNMLKNISNPTITVYLPETSNGGAVIACPGGGYSFLTIGKGDYSYAPWFNEQGIAVILLKYRLPNGHSDIPLEDIEQAMRMVKQHASEWKIDTSKIGVMGTSAGGHLASTLATHFKADTRPAFQILLYPVITMDESYTHGGTRKQLLGDNPEPEMIKLFSNEQQVTAQTPQAFIILSDDDKLAPPANSINYYTALRKNGVSTEMHIYPSGGHGWGFKDSFIYKTQWTSSLKKWLQLVLAQKH